MRWSHFFQVGKFNLFLKVQAWYKDKVRTVGYSSRVIPTSLHVLFLDYDNIKDDRLKEELTFLQEEFELGNFYVLSTSELGRHCVCLDALRAKDQMEIVEFSNCDWVYRKGVTINEYRTWILRCEPKGDRDAPKYAYTVESPYEGKNLQSVGHKMFLEAQFGVPVPELKQPYGEEAIELQGYDTMSKITKDEVEQKRGDKDEEENG